MFRQLTIVLAGALSAFALTAVSASAASGLTCAKTATVRSGTVLNLSAGATVAPDGTHQLDQTAYTHLVRSTHAITYVTSAATTVRFGAATFTLAEGTIFDLECSGRAGGPANRPSVNVSLGSASVQTGGTGQYGTLSSNNMLLDPYADHKFGMKLTRTVKGNPSLQDVIDAGPAVLTFGKTVAEQTNGSGYLNITPYVGKAARTNGQCHQAHGATTNITSLKNRYPMGTVSYRGLAPFSPR